MGRVLRGCRPQDLRKFEGGGEDTRPENPQQGFTTPGEARQSGTHGAISIIRPRLSARYIGASIQKSIIWSGQGPQHFVGFVCFWYVSHGFRPVFFPPGSSLYFVASEWKHCFKHPEDRNAPIRFVFQYGFKVRYPCLGCWFGLWHLYRVTPAARRAPANALQGEDGGPVMWCYSVRSHVGLSLPVGIRSAAKPFAAASDARTFAARDEGWQHEGTACG